MALASESNSASPTALTLDTPSTLASPSTDKTRVLCLDLTNLANGDVLEVRIEAQVDGTNDRVAYEAVYVGAQSEPIVFSPPVPMYGGGNFILEQTDGTGRSVPWRVLTLD